MDVCVGVGVGVASEALGACDIGVCVHAAISLPGTAVDARERARVGQAVVHTARSATANRKQARGTRQRQVHARPPPHTPHTATHTRARAHALDAFPGQSGFPRTKGRGRYHGVAAGGGTQRYCRVACAAWRRGYCTTPNHPRETDDTAPPPPHATATYVASAIQCFHGGRQSAAWRVQTCGGAACCRVSSAASPCAPSSASCGAVPVVVGTPCPLAWPARHPPPAPDTATRTPGLQAP